MSYHIRRSSLVRMNTQNVPLQRTLVGKVHVTYRTSMSLYTGVSGDMVKVTRTNHQAFPAGFTPVSRQILMYHIDVPNQCPFRGIRARTLRTRKSPVVMLRLDVTPQVAPPIELGPTLYTRVFTTFISVATSFEVWITNTRRNISRGRRKVLALITIVTVDSLDWRAGTFEGHLENRHKRCRLVAAADFSSVISPSIHASDIAGP